jgi:hypothetical protein
MLPVILYWSWIGFWSLSILLLAVCLFSSERETQLKNLPPIKTVAKSPPLTILLIVILAVLLSYAVTRSDLDDSFYVAIAAFSSSNPEHSLLAGDPMLREPGLPLIFPSYRFASFELLSGALGHLFSVPSMDVYYIYLLPAWAITSIAATFLLTKELIPKRWILAGATAFILTLLLGEMHRSTANFAFVRLFQGKSIFVSVVVPAIFYFTARFFSKKGTSTDLFLLACCQVTAIGLSNFGMLAAPIAGFGAIASNAPLALQGDRKKLCYALAVLFIPLPYLVKVALQLNGSPIMDFGIESAENVWTSVFGVHQQYLVAVLLLAGPVLAKDTITKWRLAIPTLIFLGIYLNPLLSSFISKYVTTPPVYWRVVWSFPILIFSAVSFSMIAIEIFEKKPYRLLIALLTTLVLGLMAYSLPFNTLREENIGKLESFASWKIPAADLIVAQRAITIDKTNGVLLAPDEIAGVISRFEKHPQLVITRGLYLYLLKPAIGDQEYTKKSIVYNFVMGNIEGTGELARSTLRSMRISLVILNIKNESPLAVNILTSEGYIKVETINNYSFWTNQK